MKISQSDTCVKPWRVVDINERIGLLSPVEDAGTICYLRMLDLN